MDLGLRGEGGTEGETQCPAAVVALAAAPRGLFWIPRDVTFSTLKYNHADRPPIPSEKNNWKVECSEWGSYGCT